jgi:hypothetical protein
MRPSSFGVRAAAAGLVTTGAAAVALPGMAGVSVGAVESVFALAESRAGAPSLLLVQAGIDPMSRAATLANTDRLWISSIL